MALRLTLRETFLWLSMFCLGATISYQYQVIRHQRSQIEQLDSELMSVKAIAAHHGVDIPPREHR